MSGLTIAVEKCIGCGLCVKACPHSALEVYGHKARLCAACQLCGICVNSCPKGALRIEKDAVAAADPDVYHGVWVFAEQQAGKTLPVAYELLNKGRVLADRLGTELCAVLLGNEGILAEADRLIQGGADAVYACVDDRLAYPMELPYADALCGLIRTNKPDILLFGATGFGRSLAPRIAARLKTGLTADCTELDIDEESGLLQQTRPAFGGNLMATIICPDHRPQMATVRPGVLPMPEMDPTHRGKVIVSGIQTGALWDRVTFLAAVEQERARGVQDAKIIVSAGKGIGKQKNMVLVRELAALLGGEVGASRPLVDAGWCGYECQIGQTGHSVAPKLLITFGISGAIQHLAGIANAETIIAVNNDPEAPIFNVATYGIVGDAVETLTAMIAAVKKSEA